MNFKIKIFRGKAENPVVSFPYNPLFVQKIKTVEGYKWHPEGKYWGFPHVSISDIYVRYNYKTEGYTTRMSYMKKLGEIAVTKKKEGFFRACGTN